MARNHCCKLNGTEDPAQLAYHEAGHAVVHIIGGDEVTEISIDPPRVVAYELPGNPFRTVHTLLGGPAAESLYLGLDDWFAAPGWEDDIDQVEETALQFLGITRLKNGRLPKKAIEWIGMRGEEAERMVLSAWPAVMRIAQAVLKAGPLRNDEEILELVYGSQE